MNKENFEIKPISKSVFEEMVKQEEPIYLYAKRNITLNSKWSTKEIPFVFFNKKNILSFVDLYGKAWYRVGMKVIIKQENKMEKQEKIKKIEQQIKELEQKVKECEKTLDKLKNPYKLYNREDNYFSIGRSKYNKFRILKDYQYYNSERTIFDALANFASENDTFENFIWGSKGLEQKKFYIELSHEGAKIVPQVNFSTSTKKLGVVYFSLREIAEAAIEMLEKEELL
jgi:hypothetical protein